MNLFQKVKEESDPFKKYSNVNRIMEITLVAVNDIYKGQGVCKALFNKTKYVVNGYLFLIDLSGLEPLEICCCRLNLKGSHFE